MPLRYDRAVLLGSAIALAIFVVAGAVLYYVAPASADLKTDLIKSLFDKVALGGVLAAFALIIGWFIEDAKARRTFVATAQLTAATEMLASASAMAKAAGEWSYYEAPDMPAEQPRGVAFEEATTAFGNLLSSKSALLDPYFVKALNRFYDLLIEPYYLYRDRNPNPMGTLHTSNLDVAEFVIALERSLHFEFLIAVGASSKRPEISLANPIVKENFAATLARWTREHNAQAAASASA